MASQMTARLGWIDVAKGLAILLVTLLHANYVIEKVDVETGYSADLHHFLEPIRMPLFFTVSGLFASSAIAGNFEQLWNRRLSTYLWLLVLWSSIMWVLGKHPMLAGDPAYPRDLFSLLKSIIRPLSSIWFLWCLPVYFVLAWILRRVDARVLLVALPIISLIGYAIDISKAHGGLLNIIKGSLAYTNTLKYFVFFWAASRFRNALLDLVPQNVVRSSLHISLFSALAIGSTFTTNIALRSLLALSASFSGVMLLLSLSKLISRTAPAGARILRELGSRTVPLYVIQLPFMMLLILPFDHHIDTTPLLAGLIHIPLAIITIVVAYIFGVAANAAGMRWLFAAPAAIKIGDGGLQVLRSRLTALRASGKPET